MIFRVLGRAIYWTLGAIQGMGELFGATRRLVREARKGVVPHVDDSEALPFSPETFRSVDSGKYSSRLVDAKPVPLTRRSGK